MSGLDSEGSSKEASPEPFSATNALFNKFEERIPIQKLSSASGEREEDTPAPMDLGYGTAQITHSNAIAARADDIPCDFTASVSKTRTIRLCDMARRAGGCA